MKTKKHNWKKDREHKVGRRFAWGVCESCGCGCWLSKDSRTTKTCSLECARRVKYPERFRDCAHCGAEHYFLDLDAKYCSVKCHRQSQHWSRQPWAQDYIDSLIVLADGGVSFKVIMRIVGGSMRQVREAYMLAGRDYDAEVKRRKEVWMANSKRAKGEVSKDKRRKDSEEYINMIRTGAKASEIAKVFNVTPSHVSLALNENYKDEYNRLKHVFAMKAKTRKCCDMESDTYGVEQVFCDVIEKILKDSGVEYNREYRNHRVGGRRLDFKVGSIAIECKVNTKSTSEDEAMGQSLLYKHILGMTPCVCYPSDCKVSEAHLEACGKAGVYVLTEENISGFVSHGGIKQPEINSRIAGWPEWHNKTIWVGKTKEELELLGYEQWQVKCLIANPTGMGPGSP